MAFYVILIIIILFITVSVVISELPVNRKAVAKNAERFAEQLKATMIIPRRTIEFRLGCRVIDFVFSDFNKKFAVLDYNTGEFIVIDYVFLAGCEITEDKYTARSGGVTAGAIAALITGKPLAAAAASVAYEKENVRVKKMSLVFNRHGEPPVCVVLFSDGENVPYDKREEAYNTAMQVSRAVYSVIRTGVV